MSDSFFIFYFIFFFYISLPLQILRRKPSSYSSYSHLFSPLIASSSNFKSTSLCSKDVLQCLQYRVSSHTRHQNTRYRCWLQFTSRNIVYNLIFLLRTLSGQARTKCRNPAFSQFDRFLNKREMTIKMHFAFIYHRRRWLPLSFGRGMLVP